RENLHKCQILSSRKLTGSTMHQAESQATYGGGVENPRVVKIPLVEVVVNDARRSLANAYISGARNANLGRWAILGGKSRRNVSSRMALSYNPRSRYRSGIPAKNSIK